jgi:glycosyltransferase involved in cell wall biosynthesis
VYNCRMSKNATNWPKVSFITPTLNAEAFLEGCLRSISVQDYPTDKVELVIADGGSKDSTLEIAKRYGAKIFPNKLKTAEAGKAVGMKHATGEYVIMVDADNVIIGKDWLRRMIKPLVEDPELFGSEPLHFAYDPEDGYLDRYFALMGLNDPLCLWLGSYDRYSYMTNRWTGIDLEFIDKGDYYKLSLEPGRVPTIGANGAVIKKSIIDKNSKFFDDYFFDMDFIEQVVNGGDTKFAKVKTSIKHIYCDSSLRRFMRKQLRRIKDYLYRRSVKDVFTGDFSTRSYTYGSASNWEFLFRLATFVVSCLTLVPLIVQSLIGYSRKPDSAWFVHPLLCWVTLITYIYGAAASFFHSQELDRENWR